MPRTIDEGFRDFLVKLAPSVAESVAAKNHRASIEACLKYNFGLKRFARIGSFGNGTSVSGCSDVDYLACLPTDQLTQVSTSSLVKMRNALDTRFPNTGVHVNCPAVVVPFGGTAAGTTEIVPADFVSASNGYKTYDIADCSGGWMKASPDAHNAYVQWVDNKLGGKVKPLIRFIKAWKYFRDVPISSFYLELRVAKFASEEKSILYEYDVRSVLKLLWDGQLARMQDPMGVSGYISPCKTDAARTDALSKLSTALTVEDLVLKVLAPLAPALLLGIRQYSEHIEAAARLDKLKDHAEKVWNEALSGKKSPTYLTTAARGLQDEILEGRRRSPLVFDVIFKRLRRDYEIQMNHGATELVAEAKRKLEAK